MSDQTIKAITLHQPWASLVAIGAKHFETRSWPTSYRGPLAIHAAKTQAHMDLCYTEPFYRCLIAGMPGTRDFPAGQVVAVCNLKDVTKCTPVNTAGLSSTELAFGDFSPGRWAWHLTDVQRFLITNDARGYQRLWTWDYSRTSQVNQHSILYVQHHWLMAQKEAH